MHINEPFFKYDTEKIFPYDVSYITLYLDYIRPILYNEEDVLRAQFLNKLIYIEIH